MRSNYKKLGSYIREVSEKNNDLLVKKLLGVSITKAFITSIANVIGTDMTKYKIVHTNQFAYGPVTSRNGDKISVALLQQDDCIISTSYTVFEIIDHGALDPEYLMMWFSRPEFDRYARYMSHGSVREIFGWDEMCDVELPIPPIEKQREIVREYISIVNRIQLNERMNQKLEETAHAIYKHWFVDFEFPISVEYAASIGKPELEGKPYKSSGGEMVRCDKLEQEIPKDWRVCYIGDYLESASKKHSFKKNKLIFFNTSDIYYGDFLHNNFSYIDSMPGQAKKSIKKDDILYSEIRPKNKRFALVKVDNADDYVVSTKLMVLRLLNCQFSILRFYNLLTSPEFIDEVQRSAEGRSGTFPQITYELDIEKKPLFIGNDYIEQRWQKILTSLYNNIFERKNELSQLTILKDLLRSGLASKFNHADSWAT